MNQQKKYDISKTMQKAQNRKKKKIQQYYYESTLPKFVKQYFQSWSTAQQSWGVTLGELELKLDKICRQSLKRLKFLKILLQQFQSQLQTLTQFLQPNTESDILLKQFCKLLIYSWKLRYEIRSREKLTQVNQIPKQGLVSVEGNGEKEGEGDVEGEEVKKEEIEVFNRKFWRLRIGAEIGMIGASDGIMVEILREVADSGRIPRLFRAKMREVLAANDFAPIEKYMRILGQDEQHSDKSTPFSYIMTPKKQKPQLEPLLQNLNTATATKKPSVHPHSSPLDPQKRIFKNKALSLGRTLHFSHPPKYKLQPNPNRIHYINQQQPNYL